jgi:hypothetical protein
MGRKRRERKTPKPAKVLYSIRVDGELDALIKNTLDILNRPGAGYTLTEMVNAILYNVFFDVEHHNTPRDFIPLLHRVELSLSTLPLTRAMVDVFFDVPPAEVQDLLEQWEQQKKNTP